MAFLVALDEAHGRYRGRPRHGAGPRPQLRVRLRRVRPAPAGGGTSSIPRAGCPTPSAVFVTSREVTRDGIVAGCARER